MIKWNHIFSILHIRPHTRTHQAVYRSRRPSTRVLWNNFKNLPYNERRIVLHTPVCTTAVIVTNPVTQFKHGFTALLFFWNKSKYNKISATISYGNLPTKNQHMPTHCNRACMLLQIQNLPDTMKRTLQY